MAIDAVFDFASVVLEDDSTVGPDDARGLIRRSSEFHRKYGPRPESPENLLRVGDPTYEDVFKSGGNLADNGFEPSPPEDWPPGSLHSRDTVVEQLSRKLRERLRRNPI